MNFLEFWQNLEPILMAQSSHGSFSAADSSPFLNPAADGAEPVRHRPGADGRGARGEARGAPGPDLLAAESSKIWNQNTKYYWNIKISKIAQVFQNIKISSDFTVFWIFSKFGAKDFCVFQGFDEISAVFSGRSRKILKKAAFPVKFCADTADISLFWIEKRILIFWWYFNTLALPQFEIKIRIVRFQILHPGTWSSGFGER